MVTLAQQFLAQKDSPLKYGSEFRGTAALSRLFCYHEEKSNIINIIQKGLCYNLDTIYEETIKSYLDAMVLRGYHKSSHSEMNSSAVEISISNEVDRRWSLPLIIGSLKTSKYSGLAPGSCITILNKREGGALYQTTCDLKIVNSQALQDHQ